MSSREDGTRQTVDRVVGDGDRFGFVRERLHDQHRAEDLFSNDSHLRRRLVEDRRSDEVPFGQRSPEPLAAAEKLRAFPDAGGDVRLDPFAMNR